MPNRVIKDSIKTSEQIDSLTWFEETFFYRLILTADDYGCVDGRIALLKSELFPLKENVTKKAVADAVAKLVKVGLLCSYTVNDKPYLFFPTWEKHQRIRNKRRKCPDPYENGISKTCQSFDRQLTADCCQLTADCLPESESESESESKSESESESNVLSSSNDDDKTARARANPVVAVYCEKISAIPSTACISELVGFSERLGAELCLRAIDIALDANARDWRYVKAILQRWQEAGFKTIADVDRAEAARQRKKGKASDEVGDKNAWMDEFIHDDSAHTRRKNGGRGWDFCELARNCTNPQNLRH